MNHKLFGGIAAHLAQSAAASLPQELEKNGRDRLGTAFATLAPVTRGEFELPSGALVRAWLADRVEARASAPTAVMVRLPSRRGRAPESGCR